MIAYCGLDCAVCPAYVATQASDLPAQERLLAQWRVEFKAPEMQLADVLCDGCAAAGRHCGYCAGCEVRACAAPRGVANCAYCPDYGCAKLASFWAMAPAARENLEAIRGGL
ncbi:MAG: DUF3795 domain-containing protein [Chloroflexi bacterium]|nr:DUF3795 domain-containing protein [Chloroflexota bacterium]